MRKMTKMKNETTTKKMVRGAFAATLLLATLLGPLEAEASFFSWIGKAGKALVGHGDEAAKGAKVIASQGDDATKAAAKGGAKVAGKEGGAKLAAVVAENADDALAAARQAEKAAVKKEIPKGTAKVVLAGGTAVGGVVVAKKTGDGLEEVAKATGDSIRTNPGVARKAVGSLFAVPNLIAISLLCFLIWIFRKPIVLIVRFLRRLSSKAEGKLAEKE